MKRLVFSVTVLIVMVVMYLPLAHSGGSTNWHVITEVWTDDKGTRLKLDSTHTNPDACTKDDWVILLASDVEYKARLAMALAAFSAGNEVSFYLNGCFTYGSTFPEVLRIAVR